MGRRWVWVVLFVSLAFNLFLVGLMAGALVVGARVQALRPQGGPQPARGLWAAAAGLTPAQQRGFHRALRGDGGEVGGKLRQSREIRRGAWRALGAEPLDAAAAKTALDRARALETDARGEVEHQIVDFAATLPAADRAALSEGLARTMSPRPRQGQRPNHRPPGAPEGPPPEQ